MGVIEDIRKALGDIPLWKRLGEVPNEVDDLKRRVAELEEKLGKKWPADVCKFCGERGLRLHDTYGPDAKGNMREEWICERCGKQESRAVRLR